MKRKFLSTFEAGRKYDLSMSYLRLLVSNGVLKAEPLKVTQKRVVWLIRESSLKAFLSKKRKPGPKPKKRS